MAHSAHHTSVQLTEVIDAPHVMRDKLREVASLIRSSRRITFITGAGMSTACGIRDYRSGADTCLDTGIGAWTEKQLQESAAAAAAAAPAAALEGQKGRKGKRKHRDGDVVDEYKSGHVSATAPPSPDEEDAAFTQLVNASPLHRLVTQNTDGLHSMSGVAASQLVELHGNSLIEECLSCHRQYRHDTLVQFNTGAPQRYTTGAIERMWLRHLLAVDPSHIRVHGMDENSEELMEDEEADQFKAGADSYNRHYTGRFCPIAKCRGMLHDNVIEFDEALFREERDRMAQAIQEADLIFVLGSSIVVNPLLQTLDDNIRKPSVNSLVMINLQLTHFEPYLRVSVHGKIDDALKMLMQELHLITVVKELQPFVLKRYVLIQQRVVRFNELELRISGLVEPEPQADTLAMIKSVTLSVDERPLASVLLPHTATAYSEKSHTTCTVTGRHTIVLSTAGSTPHRLNKETQERRVLTLQFMGYRQEPDVKLEMDLQLNKQTLVSLAYHTGTRDWQPIKYPLRWSAVYVASQRSR